MQQTTAGLDSALIGRALGPYQIEALIGRGGMSVVYRARHTALDRPVALKLLPPDIADEPLIIERFLREARAAAALQHPNIIQIYDASQYDGYYSIAMRYIDGISLAHAIPVGGLPLARAARMVDQLASALDYAHAQGVIHRDVSAANVMVEPGDRLTLLDFGIAQAREGTGLTRAGIAVGTLEYLAPERARGLAGTPRSDTYSLGILTYELLAGTRPFTATNDQELLLQHLTAPVPPISRVRPDLPRVLDDALARCLAKQPDDRYPTAAAFAGVFTAAVAQAQRRTVSSPVIASALPGGSSAAAIALNHVPLSSASWLTQRRGPWWRQMDRRSMLALPVAVVAIGLAGVFGRRQLDLGGRSAIAAQFAPVHPTAAASVQPAKPQASPTSAPGATPPAAAPPAPPTPVPTPVATPARVPVHPGSPSAAIQGFYAALSEAARTGSGNFALPYSYLTPQARQQTPYASFVTRYQSDRTGITFWFPPPTVSADGRTATVNVNVIEYPNGTRTASSVLVTVVNTTSGWLLQSTNATAAIATAPTFAANRPLLPSAAAPRHARQGKHGD